ncbi:MAG: hypothetical protein P4L59_05715 [Desulfosporosinus sp.]|nr:hypothetical protein [Desulfosporosinus sp.]
MDQILKDDRGRLIGRIKEIGVGKFEIRECTGCLKGRYDVKTNETRDDRGKLYGKGNLLTRLL